MTQRETRVQIQALTLPDWRTLDDLLNLSGLQVSLLQNGVNHEIYPQGSQEDVMRHP